MGDTGLGRGVSRSPVAETNVEDDLRLIFKPVVLSCVAANNFGSYDQFRFCLVRHGWTRRQRLQSRDPAFRASQSSEQEAALICSCRHDGRGRSPTRDRCRVDVQVLRHHVGRGMCKPVRQRELFKLGSPEDREELHVGVADVLHIVSVVTRGVTDIAGIEIHRALPLM
jgi:hypothetical protein